MMDVSVSVFSEAQSSAGRYIKGSVSRGEDAAVDLLSPEGSVWGWQLLNANGNKDKTEVKSKDVNVEARNSDLMTRVVCAKKVLLTLPLQLKNNIVSLEQFIV
jgi:hypothetical protein